MNRIQRTIISALGAGIICMGLKASPYLLENFHGLVIDAFYRRQEFVWYLSLAIPGVFISLVTGYWAQQRIPKHAVTVTACSVALFSVAMAAPALIWGRWSDILTLWYVGIATVVGGFWGWDSRGRTELNGAQ